MLNEGQAYELSYGKSSVETAKQFVSKKIKLLSFDNVMEELRCRNLNEGQAYELIKQQ